MPKVTIKGQITIPQDIRNRFGFLPGIEVDIVYIYHAVSGFGKNYAIIQAISLS